MRRKSRARPRTVVDRGEKLEAETSGTEKQELEDDNLDFHQSEYERFERLLEDERDRSELPDKPSARTALNDLPVRLRLKGPERR